MHQKDTSINSIKDIFKKHLIAFIVGPLLKIIEAVFDLLIPLFMKSIIDLADYALFATPINNNVALTNLISKFILSCGTWVKGSDELQALNYALIGGTFILVMGISGFLITMVTQYIAAKTSVKIGCETRDELYKKILSLSIKDRESISDAKLLTILNSDTYSMEQGVLKFIRLIIRAPFIIIGSLVISLILNWKIGIVFACIVPLILVIVFCVMGNASKQYVKIQSNLDDLATNVSDNLRGSKDIRALSNENIQLEKFKNLSSDYMSKAIKVNKTNSLINPLTFALITLATIMVIIFAIFPTLENNSAISDDTASLVITEVAYLLQIFTTLVYLTNFIIVLTKAIVSIKRINIVLKMEPSIKNESTLKKQIKKGEQLFKFDHVSLSYKDNGNVVLSNINFEINKGDTIGIIGGTGCGKTTLISLMVRFLDPNSGTIFYKGIKLPEYSLKELRDEISLTVQKSQLFKGTIKSNMLMAKNNASDEEIIDALKIAEAYPFIEKYEDGLNHPVEENGHNFSGGQKQRISIARSILKKPELLILDDSTSALDLLTDKKVRDNISNYLPDATKIIISQRVSTVSSCDKVLVIDKGQLIGFDNHNNLLKNCKIYKEIFDSQSNCKRVIKNAS